MKDKSWVLLFFLIINTTFAIIDIALVSYVLYKNKCQFTTIIKIVFIICSAYFALKAILSGL